MSSSFFVITKGKIDYWEFLFGWVSTDPVLSII